MRGVKPAPSGWRGDAVDARVRVEVAGAGSGPIAVRTGSSAEVLTVPMAALQRDGKDEVTMLAEGRGRVHARVRFEWTPEDPFQPAEVRGFAVRRSYEAIDDSTDVTRDADGIWRIRAGARVRVVHELFLPARRIDVRLRDPLAAGLEPVQGTTGDEGAARAQGVESVQPVFGTFLHPVLAGWRWYRESLFERDAFTAWASALPGGAYRGSYVARATAPGDFIVPGIRAWEAGRPDVRGRGEAHRVVVEVR